MKVISNSSPLINFAALGRFDLLCSLYSPLTIPEGVHEEVVIAGQRRPHSILVAQAADWIIRESVHSDTIVRALRHLGRGEAEAIALATETINSLVLMNDRQGRPAAHALGLNIIGTLGILVVAKRKGLINVLAPELEILQTRVGFRVSDSLKVATFE